MTNKEAIIWLTGIKGAFHGNCTTDTLVPISRCDVQALELAIRALERDGWLDYNDCGTTVLSCPVCGAVWRKKNE